MKKKSIMSIIVIAMVSVLMIGATMSWFTASNADNPIKNTITTGRVMISANGSNDEELAGYHLNPDDVQNIPLTIQNIGSKSVYLRFKVHYQWFDTFTEGKDIGKINENSPSKVKNSDKDLPTNNITFKVDDPNWKLTDTDTNGDIYCYYKSPVAGTIETKDKDGNPYDPSTLDPKLSAHFVEHHENGTDDNDYQGKALKTIITVEAIQSDHVVGTDNKISTWDFDLKDFFNNNSKSNN